MFNLLKDKQTHYHIRMFEANYEYVSPIIEIQVKVNFMTNAKILVLEYDFVENEIPKHSLNKVKLISCVTGNSYYKDASRGIFFNKETKTIVIPSNDHESALVLNDDNVDVLDVKWDLGFGQKNKHDGIRYE